MTLNSDNPILSAGVSREDEAGARRTFPIAVIGASAGGLGAFKELFRSLPSAAGMAFVLLQHFDPSHQSHLAEILSEDTNLPVHEIEQDDQIEPDHVYVSPPGRIAAIAGGRFTLLPQTTAPGKHLPLNSLMRSLAEELKTYAIGIVLSGTGTDGTLGLASIKAEGGITFAQAPETAEYPAMPRSAIDSGCVDFVLPPREIANELLRIQGHPYLESEPPFASAEREEDPSPPSPVPSDELATIVDRLQKVTTVNFREYKPSTLHRRALRRAAILRLNSIGEYARYLHEHPEECLKLYDDVLIPVTSFFRDPEVFETIKTQVFPILFKDPDKRSIRIWVPGCSTGEETYSLAMLLCEYFGERTSRYQVQIFGTDLNEKAIQRARSGLYSSDIVEQMSPDRLHRFFTKTEGGYRIEKSVRDLCVFARHNLATDPPFSQMHMVTCRNLLIYLQPVLQKRVIPLLHYALRPAGFLVLGGSESIAGFPELFSVFDKTHKIYTKKAAASKLHFDFIQTYYPSGMNQRTSGRHQDLAKGESEALREADRLVLENHAPVGAVINSAMEVIQFRGRPTPYLEPAPGKPTLNVLKLARNGLSVELRTLISSARKLWRTAQKHGVPFENQGQKRIVNISVLPLGENSSESAYFLILFEDVTPQWISDNGRSGDPKEKTMIESLELELLRRELADAQNALRSAIESEDSLKEEFQSANEEILSANEELQSTNEELETSKEELQSANEELNTLNAELRQKNVDLQELSSDISNLLHSTRIPVLMLDRELRIRRVTPMADKLLKVVPSDIGRQIADIRLNIDVPDLDTVVANVLETLLPMEREVRDLNGRWHNLTILPYRTQDDKIEGVVLALHDVDTIKRASEQLRKSAEFFRAVMDTVIEPLLVLDADLRVVAVNQPFLKSFKVSSEEILNHFFYRVSHGVWDIPTLRSQLEEVLSKNRIIRGFSLERDFETVGHRIMLLNAHRLASSPEMSPNILVALEDITERKRAEQDMARLAAIVESSDDAIIRKNLDGIIETWNRGAERLFGYTQEEAVGQPITLLFPPDLIDEEPKILERIRQGKHVDHYESIRRRKDGSLLHVSISVSPIVDKEGRIVAASKIARDITGRKLSELALMKAEKLAAAGRLAAVMAHEINNPLQAVVNLINLLANSTHLDQEELSYTTLASNELRRITHLTRQSLSFYRESISPCEVNLEETIEDLLNLYAKRIVTKAVSVKKKYASPNISIHTYPGEIRQVLTILLMNAMEAISDNGTITIALRRSFDWSHPNKSGVRMVVADTGCGIPKDNEQRIFEPFFTTKGEQGVGLGLWVAYGIVSRLGGSIRMRSRTGDKQTGTCFAIFLPTQIPKLLPNPRNSLT
jgi:two-component system CheB/CheR fusion protein